MSDKTVTTDRKLWRPVTEEEINAIYQKLLREAVERNPGHVKR